MKKFPASVISLAIGTFLLPLLGGTFSQEQGTLEGGNFLLALFEGSTIPFATHLCLSFFFTLPLLIALFSRKVIHIPSIKITGSLALFTALICVSILSTSFVSVTIATILEWILMISAYFAVAATAGRRYCHVILQALFAGIFVAALLGIREYGTARVNDPNYRIFANFLSPNQAGAAFAAGITLGVSLILTGKRNERLAIGAGVALTTFALMLTQSKGAILCLPIGLSVAFVMLLILRPVKLSTIAAGAILPIALGACLGVLAYKTSHANATGAPLSRFSNSAETSVQSAGFRKLLWQSAIKITEEKPTGWGMGTFQFEGSRPGLTTLTGLTHQTFLQLASEASPLAPLSLLGFIFMAVYRSARGLKRLSQINQIGIVAAISTLATTIAHNFIDSDMYIFGLGTIVFVLCGYLTTASADSQAPEVIFPQPKIGVGGCAALILPICLCIAAAEYYRVVGRTAIKARDSEAAISALKSAQSVNFGDGYATVLLGRITGEESTLKEGVELHPSPKNLRALGEFQVKNGNKQAAYTAYFQATRRDPNNASALVAHMRAAIKFKDNEIAISKAKQLIETEKTPYFLVRSQPEFIPTATYEARLFLAEQTSVTSEKAAFLQDAIRGYRQYRETTIPVLLRFFAVMPEGDFGGESKASATEKLNAGMRAIAQLSAIPYDRRPEPRLDLTVELPAFEAALDKVLK